MCSCGPLYMGEQRQNDQLEPTYSSSVPIQYEAMKPCRRWWTIGRGGERGARVSVFTVWHDDDLVYYASFSEQKFISGKKKMMTLNQESINCIHDKLSSGTVEFEISCSKSYICLTSISDFSHTSHNYMRLNSINIKIEIWISFWSEKVVCYLSKYI